MKKFWKAFSALSALMDALTFSIIIASFFAGILFVIYLAQNVTLIGLLLGGLFFAFFGLFLAIPLILMISPLLVFLLKRGMNSYLLYGLFAGLAATTYFSLVLNMMFEELFNVENMIIPLAVLSVMGGLLARWRIRNNLSDFVKA